MSATTTLELFKVLASDAAVGQTDPTIECFLEQAALRLCASAFGILFEQATIYLAAHLLLISPEGGSGTAGAGGSVTSKKTGDEAISFGSIVSLVSGASMGDADLMNTSYGRQFISIRDSRAAAAPTFIGIC